MNGFRPKHVLIFRSPSTTPGVAWDKITKYSRCPQQFCDHFAKNILAQFLCECIKVKQQATSLCFLWKLRNPTNVLGYFAESLTNAVHQLATSRTSCSFLSGFSFISCCIRGLTGTWRGAQSCWNEKVNWDFNVRRNDVSGIYMFIVVFTTSDISHPYIYTISMQPNAFILYTSLPCDMKIYTSLPVYSDQLNALLFFV